MVDTYSTTPAASQSKSNTTLVIVALGMGLLVAFISMLYTTSIKRQTQAQMVTVYKINKNLEQGDKFNRTRDVTPVRIPEVAVQSMGDVIKSEQDLGNRDKRPIERFVREGEFLQSKMFVRDTNAIDLDGIRAGYRATALPINSRTAPAGLRPGMFVDILVTISSGGTLPETHVAMEKVEVMGVGSQTDEAGGSSRSYSSITVQVKLKEAMALTAMAQNPQVGAQGFSLLIRNPNDTPTLLEVNKKVIELLRIKITDPDSGVWAPPAPQAERSDLSRTN